MLSFLNAEILGTIFGEPEIVLNVNGRPAVLVVTHARDEHVITSVFNVPVQVATEGYEFIFDLNDDQRLALLVDADWHSHYGRDQPAKSRVLAQHSRMCDKYRTR